MDPSVNDPERGRQLRHRSALRRFRQQAERELFRPEILHAADTLELELQGAEV